MLCLLYAALYQGLILVLRDDLRSNILPIYACSRREEVNVVVAEIESFARIYRVVVVDNVLARVRRVRALYLTLGNGRAIVDGLDLAHLAAFNHGRGRAVKALHAMGNNYQDVFRGFRASSVDEISNKGQEGNKGQTVARYVTRAVE